MLRILFWKRLFFSDNFSDLSLLLIEFQDIVKYLVRSYFFRRGFDFLNGNLLGESKCVLPGRLYALIL